MSQSSISRCIHQVTNAIVGTMFFEKVKFPMTQLERQAAKTTFASATAPFVGGTIGAIDCTHIAILAPKNHEEAYVNHHGYHSINVQMVNANFVLYYFLANIFLNFRYVTPI